MIDKEHLETGKSVFEHLRDNNADNMGGISTIYYEKTTTFEDDINVNIPTFARAVNKLNDNPDSTLLVSALAHPALQLAYMAQDMQGKPSTSFNPAFIRDHPQLVDRLNVETAIMSEKFYKIAKEGIANTAVKNIVLLPLSEGMGDDEELTLDVKKYMGGAINFMPSSLLIKYLDRGYRNLKKSDLIAGKEYYNYSDFIKEGMNDTTPVIENPRPDAPTLFVHTTGTTGVPKIMPRTDDIFALSYNSCMTVEGFNLSPGDIYAELYPDFPPVMKQHSGLVAVRGLTRDINPLAGLNGRFPQFLHDHNVTITTAEAQTYKTFLTNSLKDGSMPHFKYAIGCGSATGKRIGQEYNNEFKRLGMPNAFMNGYGESEMQPGTHLEVIPFKDYDPEKAHLVGKAIGNVKDRVVDLDGNELPNGTRGLLEIKPDTHTLPYLDRQEDWDKKWTEDGYNKTGDVAIKHDDGKLEIFGRHSKDNIIVGSDNKEYYAFDINQVIEEGTPNVLRAMPIGLSYPVEGLQNGVVTYIQLKPECKNQAESTLRDITTRVETNLNPNIRPLAYSFVTEFPKNAGLKDDRILLAEQRQGFYAIENNEIVKVDFDEHGKINKTPAKKIAINKKLLA